MKLRPDASLASRRSLITGAAAMAAYAALPARSRASLTTTGAGKPPTSLPGGQIASWDQTANNTAGATYSYSAVNVTNDTITWISGNGTAISTWDVLPSAGTGKWVYGLKITRPSNDMLLGITNTAANSQIGNFGSEAEAINANSGTTFWGGGTPPANQTGFTALPTGTIVYVYVNESATVGKIWFTIDNTNFWGAGGSTVNTAADVASNTGGWAKNFDARTRGVGAVLFATGQSVQLLAGTNLGITPVSGFTAIP